ncbi:MarR family transcriptional regulator [Limimaricola pyoseonensis]|uniref:DNA-binding transcriptional regulator, MarR family n=1 Tax=Limimaricola pyoseonensis TaxID=521013 RepID=A0A1G7IJQ4_9RHOB|nr:MarR family transcriptional regulator [Limimaricola pyoseonensis]SDF13000.1 DNA-binding transcriptional regulator, MarR family [Limimaricola pyoseonensis]
MDEASDDTARGEMLLGLVLLYWALHERMECVEPEFTRQERVLLLRLGTPRRMGQLAHLMQAQPSAITALADGFEERGLARRRRDPEDRRVWLLELTDQGRTLRREMLDHLDRILHETTGLADDELEILCNLLLKTRDHIKATGLPKVLPL